MHHMGGRWVKYGGGGSMDEDTEAGKDGGCMSLAWSFLVSQCGERREREGEEEEDGEEEGEEEDGGRRREEGEEEGEEGGGGTCKTLQD